MKPYFDPILGKLRVSDAGSGGVTPQELAVAINEHNSAMNAHSGRLMPEVSSYDIGKFPICEDGTDWSMRFYGVEDNEDTNPLDGIFAVPEKVYSVEIVEPVDIYIDLDNNSPSYNFEIAIFVGETVYSFTLYGQTHDLYWPDDNIPPHFNLNNLPPAMNQPNTMYVVRCRWDAQARVILANLAYTVEV